MTFKAHDKLNRITELALTLQREGIQIDKMTKKIREDEKALDLLTVHYMQTEMEYGKLIGENIDYTAAIVILLARHQNPEGENENVSHA